jgi:diguanylate cyclase (GGDEF)-like protein
MARPEPENEIGRIAALRALDILDTPPTPEFDALARLAAANFGTDKALVSLLDTHRQWFKARIGIAVSNTPRRFAFCRYTILGRKPMIIEDAQADARFRDNPFVLGEPHIRFYAGYPLALDGEHNVGSLCVIGDRPLRPKRAQIERFVELGTVAEGLLRAHAAIRRAERADAAVAERTRAAETQARFLQQIEQIASIGAWTLDLATEEVTGSPQLYEIYDIDPTEPFTMERGIACYPEADRKIAETKLAEAIVREQPFTFDLDLVTPKGRRKRVRAMGDVEKQDGAVRRLVGVIQDVSAEHEAMQRLWRAAHIDDLTGLANRTWFRTRLAEAIDEARAAARGVALMILDLDAFKEVNDRIGHRAGDAVIRTLAERFAAAAGEDSFVARLGSDEFAALLGETEEAALRRIADDVAAQIRRPVVVEGSRLFLSGSIGIARYPADATTGDDLHKCADVALYRVKQSGRGAVGFFTQELGGLFDQRRAAVELVRQAGAEGRIRPFYQPMVRLPERTVYGFEALVRIREADGGVCGPQAFWRAFDDPESARQIDDQMFQQVTAHIAHWRAAGLDPGVVSVNVSEYYFKSADFAERVLHRLSRLAIPPSALKLEVTETILLGEDTARVGAILSRLHEAGVAIALDDFGTGYASLTHLRDFPIDVIKIDRTFLRDVGRKPASAVIVKAMIELAANLGVKVVAEGVETEAQAAFLTEAGCGAAQGYLFGAAMPAAEVEREVLAARAANRGDGPGAAAAGGGAA